MIPSGPRFPRLIEHLHRLGPRAVGELLAEIATKWDIPDDDLVSTLERYGRLSPEMLAALNGVRFASPPMTAIAGGKETR